jgi:hypothetical protein
MRISLFLVAAMAVSLAGCLTTQEAEQPPIPSTKCKQGQDCDAKWSRAVEWVSQNSAYKIQTQTDALIQTYSGTIDEGDTGLSMTVTKAALGQPGEYEIVARMGCANPLGCFPEPRAALVQFAAFVSQ